VPEAKRDGHIKGTRVSGGLEPTMLGLIKRLYFILSSNKHGNYMSDMFLKDCFGCCVKGVGRSADGRVRRLEAKLLLLIFL
jgi:hypothetical protein